MKLQNCQNRVAYLNRVAEPNMSVYPYVYRYIDRKRDNWVSHATRIIRRKFHLFLRPQEKHDFLATNPGGMADPENDQSP